MAGKDAFLIAFGGHETTTYDVERMSFIILLRMQIHRCSYIPHQIPHYKHNVFVLFQTVDDELSIMHERIASASVHPAFCN